MMDTSCCGITRGAWINWRCVSVCLQDIHGTNVYTVYRLTAVVNTGRKTVTEVSHTQQAHGSMHVSGIINYTAGVVSALHHSTLYRPVIKLYLGENKSFRLHSGTGEKETSLVGSK